MVVLSRLQKFVSSWQRLCLAVFATATLVLSPLSHAGTIVDVSTPLGDFQLELFDDTAPITVTNFLRYVTAGLYDNIIIHRSPENFVVQGGQYSVDEAGGLAGIPIFGTISNEFGASNTRGTIAMARAPDQVNSATSQWFFNVVDNTFLDSVDEGFTVFGRVLGDGMAVVDAINQIDTFTLNGLRDFPLYKFSGGTVTSANLFDISMAVHEEPTVEYPNVFNEVTNELDVKLDAGTLGFASISLRINTTEPDVVVQLVQSSIVMLTQAVDNMATFDDATGELLIPELIVNDAVAYRNLLFILSDAELYLFALQSFEAI